MNRGMIQNPFLHSMRYCALKHGSEEEYDMFEDFAICRARNRRMNGAADSRLQLEPTTPVTSGEDGDSPAAIAQHTRRDANEHLATEDSSSCAEDSSRCTEDSSRCTEDSSSCTEDSSRCTEDSSSCTEDSSSCTEDSSSCTEDGKRCQEKDCNANLFKTAAKNEVKEIRNPVGHRPHVDDHVCTRPEESIQLDPSTTSSNSADHDPSEECSKEDAVWQTCCLQ